MTFAETFHTFLVDFAQHLIYFEMRPFYFFEQSLTDAQVEDDPICPF